MTYPKEALIERLELALERVRAGHYDDYDWAPEDNKVSDDAHRPAQQTDTTKLITAARQIAAEQRTGAVHSCPDTLDALADALASLSASVGVMADFDTWWSDDGQYLDPDTSDVPWFDKRRSLAEAAYDAGAATGGKPWPDFVAPPKHDNAAPGWVDPALPDFRLIWTVAKKAGYAVGLHGSMKRDCDMIAVPWVEAHTTPQELINRLCGALNAREVGPREPKPNGRIAVNVQIDGWFRLIDLSIFTAALSLPSSGGEVVDE